MRKFLPKGQRFQEMPMIRLPGNGLVICLLRRDHRSSDGVSVMLLGREQAGMSQPPADKLNVCASIQMPDGKSVPKRVRRGLVRERLCLLCRGQRKHPMNPSGESSSGRA